MKEMMMKEAVMSWLLRHSAEIEATFFRLHDLAETSWNERNTTDFLMKRLEDFSANARRFEMHTGLVAEWFGQQDGPTVALRADIDAVWQNVDGRWKANHSCGHDAHMTMVLYAWRCLQQIGFRPTGKLIAIFQPAEEAGEGARKLIDSGILDEIDYMFGVHLRPLRELPRGQAAGGIYHGAVAFLEGTIYGKQAHASRPNEGINVIDALASIVTALNAVKVDPVVPASCKMTRIGTDHTQVNIIPDQVKFAVDVRAQTNEAMDRLLQQAETAIRKAGSANGALVDVEVKARMAAAVPDAGMEHIVDAAIHDVLGNHGVAAPPVTPGGEDFHFYPLLLPHLRATMLGLGANLQPGLHHPHMKFDLDALREGAAILALSVIRCFEQT